MLRRLSEFVVKVVDLLEAEGRLARSSVYRLALGVLLAGGATVLALTGILALAGAVYMALRAWGCPPAWALGAEAVGLLALAWGAFVLAHQAIENDK